jgi:hypothetical protein
VFQKIIDNDQVIKKKTSSDLGSIGSPLACWNHRCMGGCAEEGDTGVVTTASKDLKSPGKIN